MEHDGPHIVQMAVEGEQTAPTLRANIWIELDVGKRVEYAYAHPTLSPYNHLLRSQVTVASDANGQHGRDLRSYLTHFIQRGKSLPRTLMLFESVNQDTHSIVP